MDYKLPETEARLAREVERLRGDLKASRQECVEWGEQDAMRSGELRRLREQLVLADRLAATVEAALTFHPDREVERIPERLPAIGDALAAFRAAREGGNQ